jgi:UDP-GlcNAc3NAcA epimerase
LAGVNVKIATIVGARPQFIKTTVVSRAMRDFSSVREVLIHTGQHYDVNMSDVFFDELDIPRPDYNLDIGGGTHGQNTGRIIEKIEQVYLKENPDWVLVYGDTDSTIAATLSAVKLHIPVAHVEAGLRSFNRRMPEEINRVLTDHASSLLFTPTNAASQNLLSEGISKEIIHQVGDVMYDAALYYSKHAERKSRILNNLKIKKGEYVLATVHRAENTDDPKRMECILAGFAKSRNLIVWPLHPRTKASMERHGLNIPSTVKLLKPVGYLDMLMLEKNAMLIATDSGGMQKEAYFHNVPCVTLRNETEWLELLDVGANRLSLNPESESYEVNSTVNLWSKPLYGSGDAAGKIARRLLT